MQSSFDRGIDRIGTSCIKWDMREEIFGNPDVIPFSIADSDFPVMSEITDALKKRIDRDALGYTEMDDAYYNSVINWCKNRHDYDVRKNWIISTSGILEAVVAACSSLLNKGDRVIIQTPVYDPFETIITACGCKSVHNKLIRREDGTYEMDYGDLEDAMRGGAEMLILCSPHNPVGRVWTEDELLKVLELCRKHDVTLVSDEIHWDIIMPGRRHVTMGALINDEDKAIVCTAPSKTFNIAGLQASNVIIRNEELRDKFTSWLHSRYMFGANLLGLTACTAAYEYGADWVDAQNEYIAGNAEAVYRFFDEHLPNASVTRLEGTYLMWIDLSYLGKTSDELVELIAKNGAGLNSGAHYGKQCEGFVRMNIACPRELLNKGLESILNAVMSLEG